MSNYIINANTIYYNLKESIDDFEIEAKIIDSAKCHLINYGDLDDYEYDGADVYETSYGYNICYADMTIKIETEEGVIVDYYFN